MDEFIESVSSGNSANQAALERNRTIRENFKLNKKQYTRDIGAAKQKVASFQAPITSDVRVETAGGNLAKDSGLVTDLTKSLKSAASVGTTVAERAGSIGKLGLGATGLGVALGAKDVVDDLVNRKIEGNNAAEKVSNVSNIAAGALEGLGTALDLTGAAAPVGVALQAAGGLVGLFGAGSDLVGEEEEKKKAQGTLSSLQKAPPVQEKIQAVQAGTAGEVKVN
jgi:hypothetical protein